VYGSQQAFGQIRNPSVRPDILEIDEEGPVPVGGGDIESHRRAPRNFEVIGQGSGGVCEQLFILISPVPVVDGLSHLAHPAVFEPGGGCEINGVGITPLLRGGRLLSQIMFRPEIPFLVRDTRGRPSLGLPPLVLDVGKIDDPSSFLVLADSFQMPVELIEEIVLPELAPARVFRRVLPERVDEFVLWMTGRQ